MLADVLCYCRTYRKSIKQLDCGSFVWLSAATPAGGDEASDIPTSYFLALEEGEVAIVVRGKVVSGEGVLRRGIVSIKTR